MTGLASFFFIVLLAKGSSRITPRFFNMLHLKILLKEGLRHALRVVSVFLTCGGGGERRHTAMLGRPINIPTHKSVNNLMRDSSWRKEVATLLHDCQTDGSVKAEVNNNDDTDDIDRAVVGPCHGCSRAHPEVFSASTRSHSGIQL